MTRRFGLLETVTWIGSSDVRPRGSTGKVRELGRRRVYVDWGYERGVPRTEQPHAEGWERREDLLPGFVDEDDLPPRADV